MIRRIFAVFALLSVAAVGALAQAAPPVSADQAAKGARLNRAPVNKEILRVKLPKPMETTLENGLTVLILEDHRFPLVSVSLNISGAGALYDPPHLPGLANMTATMLREGTKTRTGPQIAEGIDRMGATIGASTNWGSSATLVSASGLSDNFDEWFALATDLLLNPTFPANELNRIKGQAKAGLRQQRSQSGFLAGERFNRAIFGSHPAAVRSATTESIDAFTPETLAKWHAERFVPQNAIIGIAGDVNAAETIAKLKKWLAAWKRSDLKETLPPAPAAPAGKKIYIVHRPAAVQSDLALGNMAIERVSPDYVIFDVMNQIVGATSGSRLFRNLREAKGYTYGAYSGFIALKYPGPWQATSQVRNEVTDGAMTEFLNEIGRIRDEAVPAQELEEQKRLMVARFALSLEQPQTMLNFAITRKIYGFPEDYWDTYPTRIMAVTAGDVQRVARKYINPDTLQVVAVGDASKIKSVLEKFGAVEVYDADGKPMPEKPAAPPSMP